MDQQKDDVETLKHKVEPEEAKEGKEESLQSHIDSAGQAPLTTNPTKSQVKSDTEVEEYDLWGVDVCAPEDDPLMGEVTRALYASELVDGETAVEVLEGLEKAVGPAKLSGEDDEVDESDKAYAEEVARGYKMTLKELFADIKRIDREIMADLDFTTKAFEMMGSIAAGPTAGERSND